MEISFFDVNADFFGFSQLLKAYEIVNRSDDGDVLVINMPNWFAANMCSVFGVLLDQASKKGNRILLNWSNIEVRDILRKNNFLVDHGFDVSPLEDSYHTTVKYHKFGRNDNSIFCDYVENDFMGRLPSMSNALSKEFKKSIFEIFENAIDHSETETIFSCGQVFYHKNILDFSITDIGMGFHKNVTSKTHQWDLTPTEAIIWAMEKNRTTKSGPIPGGLGLKLIKEFITLNEGKMQIASDYGYWELSDGVVKTGTFMNRFPGTIVNIEINTADPCSYYLDGEIESEDIF